MDKSTLIDRMQEKKLQNFLSEIGKSRAIEIFVNNYGKLNTKTSYVLQLALYFRWLKKKGILMSPDELIRDNLNCVYKSDPTDISTKRRHTDWLLEYVNSYLIEKGASESMRKVAAAAIRKFYELNDSPLFGHFNIINSEAPRETPKPLSAEDIRTVLKALPIRYRAPLLIIWQSGLEPRRMLSMNFPINEEPPVRIDILGGRKNHRRAYFTYIGRDSVEALRMLGPLGFPSYNSLRQAFKDYAMKLARQGLIANRDPRAWHPYALRHSFKTEAEHAGAKTQVVEFFMGHIQGISWTYDHRGELHEEDFRREYLKIEPYISLNPDETVIRNEFQTREEQLRKEIHELRALFERLKAQLGI